MEAAVRKMAAMPSAMASLTLATALLPWVVTLAAPLLTSLQPGGLAGDVFRFLVARITTPVLFILVNFVIISIWISSTQQQQQQQHQQIQQQNNQQNQQQQQQQQQQDQQQQLSKDGIGKQVSKCDVQKSVFSVTEPDKDVFEIPSPIPSTEMELKISPPPPPSFLLEAKMMKKTDQRQQQHQPQHQPQHQQQNQHPRLKVSASAKSRRNSSKQMDRQKSAPVRGSSAAGPSHSHAAAAAAAAAATPSTMVGDDDERFEALIAKFYAQLRLQKD